MSTDSNQGKGPDQYKTMEPLDGPLRRQVLERVAKSVEEAQRFQRLAFLLTPEVEAVIVALQEALRLGVVTLPTDPRWGMVSTAKESERLRQSTSGAGANSFG